MAAWWAAAALAAAGQAHALGVALPYESFATAPDVDMILVCGQWRAQAADGPAGAYRIVHATRHGQSFLYVQWIHRDSTDTATEVHTESFGAINNDHASLTLTQMNCQPTRRGIRLTARAQSGHDGSAFRITIDAGHAPGEARFRTSRRR